MIRPLLTAIHHTALGIACLGFAFSILFSLTAEPGYAMCSLLALIVGCIVAGWCRGHLDRLDFGPTLHLED